MRMSLCKTRVAMFVLATYAAMAMPVAAQESADVRQELAAMRAELQQLRAEVAALKAARETVPAPETPAIPQQSAAIELLTAQVAELAQTKVESTSRFPVKMFGTVHANVFANSATPNWLDIPEPGESRHRPTAIPERSARRCGRRASDSRPTARRSAASARAPSWRWISSAAFPAFRPVRSWACRGSSWRSPASTARRPLPRSGRIT